MITLNNITKQYGAIMALDNLSLKITQGEVVAIVGLNGAGKSTMIKSIIGLVKPDQGTISICNLSNNDVKAKSKLAYAPEIPCLYDFLTSDEHVEFIGKIYNHQMDLSYYQELLHSFDLVDKKKMIVKDFSKGQKQKVSLLIAFMLNKEILLLDEPFSGVDPVSIINIQNSITEFKQKGKTILISTHIVDLVKEFVDKIVIINHGKIVKELKYTPELDLKAEFLSLAK